MEEYSGDRTVGQRNVNAIRSIKDPYKRFEAVTGRLFELDLEIAQNQILLAMPPHIPYTL